MADDSSGDVFRALGDPDATAPPGSGVGTHGLPGDGIGNDTDVMALAKEMCIGYHANSTEGLVRDGETFCGTWFDSVLCWPPTVANTTVVAKCFDKLNGIRYSRDNVTKHCEANGTWALADYSMCTPIVEHATSSHGTIITTSTIYIIGYSLSLIALAIAIAIFIYFKDLRCLRNTIHTNLMIAYFSENLLWLLTYLLEMNLKSQAACFILVLLFNYFHLTTFFWMFVEGLYLFILVVKTFSRENLKLRVYIVTGWIVPIFFMVVWAAVKGLSSAGRLELEDEKPDDDRSTNEFFERCHWMRPHQSDWIYLGPAAIVLTLNLYFLLAIMRVLITKLRSANTVETQQYRKAAKALLVLMPLLGVTYILTIIFPSTDEFTKNAFDYTRSFFLSTQGLTVAALYCFLNNEVQNTLKHRFWTWRTTRNVGQDRLRSGSTRSPRSRTESIRLYSHPTYLKRESCTSEITTTTLITVNGGSRPSNGGSTARSPFLCAPRPSFPGNV